MLVGYNTNLYLRIFDLSFSLCSLINLSDYLSKYRLDFYSNFLHFVIKLNSYKSMKTSRKNAFKPEAKDANF